MYAIPKGRDAVAPWPGRRSRRSTSLRLETAWGEQPSDQLGSLSEPPLLGRSCRGGKFSLDLREHLRQRDREREDGAVQVGRGHSRFPCSGLSGHLPAAGWRRGLTTRHRSRGVIRAGLPALCPRTPNRKSRSFGGKPAYTRRCQRHGHHAAVCHPTQADAWFPPS
jgi:hypothetical protein